MKITWSKKLDKPVVNGIVAHPNEQGTYRHVFFSPTHVVKHHIDEATARLESSAGRFMRKLGIHEVPQHHYVNVGGRHLVVTDRVQGDGGVKDTVTQSPQRIADMIGAERYIGAADRHGGNYLTDTSGKVRPIDFEMSYHTNPDRSPLHNALSLYRLKQGHLDDPEISPDMRKVMRYHLPLLKVFLTHHVGSAGYKRWAKVHDAVKRDGPLRLSDLS